MVKKEYDYLKVKLKQFNLKNPSDEIWYDSILPVYTCQGCGKGWVAERVNK